MASRKPAFRRYPWLRIENFDQEIIHAARRVNLTPTPANRAAIRDAYTEVMTNEYPDVDLMIMTEGEVNAAQPRPDIPRSVMEQIFRDRLMHAAQRVARL